MEGDEEVEVALRSSGTDRPGTLVCRQPDRRLHTIQTSKAIVGAGTHRRLIGDRDAKRARRRPREQGGQSQNPACAGAARPRSHDIDETRASESTIPCSTTRTHH